MTNIYAAEAIRAARTAREAVKKARMVEGAKRYAAADRTDPFAYARAMTHIKCGVATVIRQEHNKDYDLDRAATAFYNAENYIYDREVPGIGEVPTIGYRSMVRP